VKGSKKILVTGGAGFIGFHLSKRLIKEDYEVIGLDSINDYYDTNLKKARLKILNETQGSYSFVKHDISRTSTIDLLKEINPSFIVNLAANAGVRYSIQNPRVYVKNNIYGFLNILEAAKEINLKNLVYASTSSVYGANTDYPFSEKKGVDHPLQFYAVTKRTNELMAHSYASLFNIKSTGLRFFTVYGPWGRPDMALFLFTKNILRNKPIKIFNNGDHLRDFTYVDDIVDGIHKAIFNLDYEDKSWDSNKPDPSSSYAPFRIFNIGASDPVHLMDYVKEIENNLGIEAIKEFCPLQPGDVKATTADITNIQTQLGYSPSTNIKTGVKNFVDWYREYYQV
jgi:UDP-glucuronate 4-epimerase